jgi:hypothetical protein
MIDQRRHVGSTVVKKLLALVFAVPFLVGPALADEKTVRANCSTEILKSTAATRGDLKSFRVAKSGGGYQMSGQTQENRTVVCSADEDGHVTFVSER